MKHSSSAVPGLFLVFGFHLVSCVGFLGSRLKAACARGLAGLMSPEISARALAWLSWLLGLRTQLLLPKTWE